MAHSMGLNNRISCVVGISIFGFKIYWTQVFDMMEIQTTQTFEQFLQAETLNAEKNKSYYQKRDLHLWIQEILETSVRFVGDTNNVNLKTVLASRNTQRREEQIILSKTRCQLTESLLQAGNDQTANIQ